MGLRWQDVDFKEKTITVKDTVIQRKALIDKERTKTQSSYRTLPLLSNIEAHLLKLKEQHEEYKILFGSEYTDNDYICKREDGNLIAPDTITLGFTSLLKKHNLPRIRFHDLRHSCASMLIALGIDIKKISEWLGHSSISTTADIYGHIQFVSKIEMGEMLEKSLTA